MRKRLGISVSIIALVVLNSCTDYREEDLAVTFGVNTTQLSFLTGGDSRSVTVSSGKKWDVPTMPQWISIQSITRSGTSPYEWTASFSAASNDEFNREGRIVIKTGTETAEIFVSQEGKKGRYVAVESVSVSPTELTLTEGEKTSLAFVISPSNASVKDVKWKSSDSSVATVSQTGEVEAITEGTALITITTEDGDKTATCSIAVRTKVIPVTGVSLDKTNITLTEGDMQTLVAIVSPSNATDKSVTWSSSNSMVATVSSSGLVTAKSVGSATITVKTSDGGKTAVCQVVVKEPTKATSISLVGANFIYAALVGKEYSISVDIKPEDAKVDLEWSISDETLADISGEGRSIVLHAKDFGPSTLMVRDKISNLSVSEEMKARLSDFYWTENTEKTYAGCPLVEIEIGEEHQLQCHYTPEYATRVFRSDMGGFWYYEPYGDVFDEPNRYVSKPSFFSINENGKITGIKEGLAKIQVYSPIILNNAQDLYVRVTQRQVPVTGVSLNKTSLSMTVGDTQTLTATVTPSNATDKSVTWSSSNTSVATVSSSGVVTAKAAGSATITVTTNDGSKTASCSVVVVSDSFDYVDLGLPSGLKWATCNIGASSPEEYGDDYAWGETETKSYDSFSNWNYKWYSSGTITKYNNIDKKTVLEETDDVAHVKLGGTWRIPTDAEWTELRTQCSWTWTQLNGRSGRLVTGKNGNSIFLPAAGASGNITRYYAGTYGNYWSSSLNTGDIYEAWYVTFDSDNVYRDSYTRYVGISVRAVTE